MPNRNQQASSCPGITRRSFLADTGMGFTGLALAAMLQRDGGLRAADTKLPPDGTPHFTPKARAVIWIFLCGGVSHVESFDIKSELNKYAGKSISDTPYKDALNPERLKDVVAGNPSHGDRKVLMALNTGYRKYGQCGLEVADWWQHTGASVPTTSPSCVPCGRSTTTTVLSSPGTRGVIPREGAFPTIGSWISYGLGTMNQNLPEYVVLGTPTGDCCGGEWTHGAAYLGPEHAGVRLEVGGKEPLPFVRPPKGVTTEQQTAEFSLLGRLNRLSGIDYPDDAALRARIKAYELAFGMQTAVPETLQLEKETEPTRRLYGLDQPTTRPFGELCLAARRLVERGVRFVQIFHGGGGGGAWDAHAGIKANHGSLSGQVDLPIAGLLRDLKRSGLLDETVVVWGTEFGRSPGAQGDGRDHHPQGFCAWLAGAGVKRGVVHGATDEIGFHAVEHRHYVTDIHATVLQLLGLDAHKLDIPGRKRLEIDHGRPIQQILA